MKKFTALLLILILLVSLAGCGNTPSEPASDTANNSDQVDNTNETTKVKLKTYYEVIYEGELLEALNYFDDNYDDFDEESRNDYKNALKEELTKLGEKYKAFMEIEQQAPEFPVQGTIEYVDLFYPNVFDSEKYTFNINTLDDELKNKANELKEDKIFSLCKSYWATDGFITDTGFEAIVKKDVYDIIEDRLLDGEDDEIINVNSYTDHIGSMDSVFESEAGDPKVLVENTDKLDLFKDASKTTLYVPVKIVDNPIDQDVSEQNDETQPKDSNEEDGSTNQDTNEENDETAVKNSFEYLKDTEYSFDLNKDGKADRVVYFNDYTTMNYTINGTKFEIDDLCSDMTYNEFMLADIDANDNYLEIVNHADAPFEDLICFYRYDGENFYSIGTKHSTFGENDKGVITGGNGEVLIMNYSHKMYDGIYYKAYSVSEAESLEEILPGNMYTYTSPITSKVNDEIRGYNGKSIDESYETIPVGDEIVIYGEIDNWLNIKWNDKELWVNDDELTHYDPEWPDVQFEFDGIKFSS